MVTGEQREALARDGYVVVSGLVDAERVDDALRLVNSWFMTGFDAAERLTYYAQTFAPEHTSNDVITGLATQTAVLEFASELVGRPIEPPTAGQIALRFPMPPEMLTWYEGPHVDGVPTDLNGVPNDGVIHGFTLLAGVMLSDTPEPDQGNFTVWPGSHLAMARWFDEHDTRIPDPQAFFGAVEGVARATSESLPVPVRAGDVVFAHHLLAHANGGHAGPRIRYATFFRLSSDVRWQLGDAVLTDPWAEWDAMRDWLETRRSTAV